MDVLIEGDRSPNDVIVRYPATQVDHDSHLIYLLTSYIRRNRLRQPSTDTLIAEKLPCNISTY